jgi:hypothetical protein
MDWVEVDRDKCIALGLIEEDDEISTPSIASLTPGERDIAEAVERYGFPQLMEGIA